MTDSLDTSTLSLSARLEALLFAAPEPVTAAQLGGVLDLSAHEIEVGLEELGASLRDRGIRLQRHQGRIQLTTAPEMAEDIELFLGLDASSRLSTAAVETLSIIAYKQPATRPQIEAIRGVNCDGVIRSLLRKGLIEEAGRSEAVGRPILYTVTSEFLQQFGLNSLEDLPPLQD